MYNRDILITYYDCGCISIGETHLDSEHQPTRQVVIKTTTYADAASNVVDELKASGPTLLRGQTWNSQTFDLYTKEPECIEGWVSKLTLLDPVFRLATRSDCPFHKNFTGDWNIVRSKYMEQMCRHFDVAMGQYSHAKRHS